MHQEDICKCCQNKSLYLGSVPFNKALETHQDIIHRDFMGGETFNYFQCQTCGFLQSKTLDTWSFDDLKKYIYNDRYGFIDTGYLRRIDINTTIMNGFFTDVKHHLSILDYGSGDDNLLEKNLKKLNYQCRSFDPFYHDSKDFAKQTYNLITLFEVFEHHTNPSTLLNDIKSFLSKDGIVLFSTELLPENFSTLGLDWWYVLPRAGHISIFSEMALKKICEQAGLHYQYLTKGLHLAWRGNPSFGKVLQHLIQQQSYCALNHRIYFANPLHYFLHCRQGWADREDWGMWSIGKKAELNFYFAEEVKDGIYFKMNGRAFLHDKHRYNQIRLYANHQLLKTWHFKRRKINFNRNIKTFIPKSFLPNKTLHLTIEIENPISPKNLGVSEDSRELGFAVNSCQFSKKRFLW